MRSQLPQCCSASVIPTNDFRLVTPGVTQGPGPGLLDFTCGRRTSSSARTGPSIPEFPAAQTSHSLTLFHSSFFTDATAGPGFGSAHCLPLPQVPPVYLYNLLSSIFESVFPSVLYSITKRKLHFNNSDMETHLTSHSVVRLLSAVQE